MRDLLRKVLRVKTHYIKLIRGGHISFHKLLNPRIALKQVAPKLGLFSSCQISILLLWMFGSHLRF